MALVAEFDKLTKVYRSATWPRREVRALDGVTLSVKTGEIFGVVGPNRAGKTTLIKVLLSMCRPTEGRVRRLGAPVWDRSTLARVGYVHESQAFPNYLTASQLLEYYGALSFVPGPLARRRGGALLERFGLADRANEPIRCFSKGMLQRLALAQALINDPELLVLDEPSEGMDLVARRLLDEVLNERKALGHSAILISHALSEVERCCDRVAVIRAGRAAFVGPVADLAASQAAGAGYVAGGNLESALAPYYEEALA
jgi:ABC-2 type transport system ATP-binding protein